MRDNIVLAHGIMDKCTKIAIAVCLALIAIFSAASASPIEGDGNGNNNNWENFKEWFKNAYGYVRLVH